MMQLTDRQIQDNGGVGGMRRLPLSIQSDREPAPAAGPATHRCRRALMKCQLAVAGLSAPVEERRHDLLQHHGQGAHGLRSEDNW